MTKKYSIKKFCKIENLKYYSEKLFINFIHNFSLHKKFIEKKNFIVNYFSTYLIFLNPQTDTEIFLIGLISFGYEMPQKIDKLTNIRHFSSVSQNYKDNNLFIALERCIYSYGQLKMRKIKKVIKFACFMIRF